MLAASNIPSDEKLPQLVTIASEAAMASLFAAHLEPGWQLRKCRIRDPRYYPGFACLLAYHLKVESPAGDPSMLTLYGRAFGCEPPPEAFRNRPPLATPIGRFPSWLPQLGLALWSFPDDPGVLGLADVWRRGGTTFDRPGLLVHTPWRGRRPSLETVLVSYVPSKRCILRYDQLDHAQPESFYGKVYAHDDAARLFAQMQALWDYSQRSAPELVLARPLGCDPKSNALWQGSPGGDALLEVMDPETLPQVMRRVAAALAALHRSDLELKRTWSVQDETVKLERARAALGRFYPMLVPQIDLVLGALVQAAPPEATRRVPVHGDFHCNQVLVQEDRVAIIDFDLCGRGDPLHDVARFLSRFRAYARGRLSADVFDRAQESFLSTYEILVPWAVDRRRLAWWMAVLLVNRQALKAVKKLAAGGGPEPLAGMLAMAAATTRDEELR